MKKMFKSFASFKMNINFYPKQILFNNCNWECEFKWGCSHQRKLSGKLFTFLKTVFRKTFIKDFQSRVSFKLSILITSKLFSRAENYVNIYRSCRKGLREVEILEAKNACQNMKRFRKSLLQMFCEIGVLKNFIDSKTCNFIKKRLQH